MGQEERGGAVRRGQALATGVQGNGHCCTHQVPLEIVEHDELEVEVIRYWEVVFNEEVELGAARDLVLVPASNVY